MEIIWLIQRLAPAFKTICKFRKLNKKAFVQASAKFIHYYQKLDLISTEHIAIGGTHIKASNSKKKSWSESNLKRKLKKYEAEAKKYLTQIEEADHSEANIPRTTK